MKYHFISALFYKRSIYYAFLIIVLDSFSFSLIMPLMPDLLVMLGCASVSKAAFYGGIMMPLFALMQVIFAPFFGRLSDYFGRRPLLILSLLFLLVDYIIKGFAQSIWMLVVGRIICGITINTYSTASAIISDVYVPNKRAQYFGLLASGLGLGFILGSVLSGFISVYGIRFTVYAAILISFANMMFAYFALQETVSINSKITIKPLFIRPMSAFKITSFSSKFMQLVIALLFYNLAFSVYVSTWSYFLKEKFVFSASMIGVSLGFFGLSAVIAQGLMLKKFLKLFDSIGTALLALFISIISYFLYAFASEQWMIFILIPFSALATVFLPAAQSMFSNLVGDEDQGQVQGIIASVTAISTVVAPPLFTLLFSYFTNENSPIYFPGIAFLLAMVFTLISIIYLWRFKAAFILAEKMQEKLN